MCIRDRHTPRGKPPAHLFPQKGRELVAHQAVQHTAGLLGVEPVSYTHLKAHGSSNAKAFKNAVRQAKLCVESGAVESMREKLAAVAQTEEAGA